MLSVRDALEKYLRRDGSHHTPRTHQSEAARCATWAGPTGWVACTSSCATSSGSSAGSPQGGAAPPFAPCAELARL